MGSALLNTIEDPVVAEVAGESATGARRPNAADAGPARPASTDALRQEVAERLAAHRRRRAGAQSQTRLQLSPEAPHPATTRAARIAATVAERYAHTQSYRAFLAAEADRAVQQAHAAAEVAALNAQAVVAAQQRLLEAFDEAAIDHAIREDASNGNLPHEVENASRAKTESQATGGVELNLWPDLEPESPSPHKHRRSALREPGSSAKAVAEERWPERSVRPSDPASNLEPRTSNPGFTVRLYEDAASAAQVYLGASRRASNAGRTNHYEERNEAEARALDEEIAFRRAPVFEEPAGPTVPLPANLIEFPRQLVASRKARPRYAEGPLRDEAAATPGDGQLRIFEVDPDQISTQPAADSDPKANAAATPQWTAIWLDTPPEAAEMEDGGDRAYVPDSYSHTQGSDAQDSISNPRSRAVPQLYVASLGRRAIAAAINGAIVLVGLLAFAATSLAVFLKMSGGGLAWQAGGSLQALRQVASSTASQIGLPLNLALVTGAVAAAFLILLYQALFCWFADATPGMRCARIALCTFDDENPTRRAMRRRTLATLLSACPLGFGFLWAALDEHRLTWHDRISRIYLRSY